MKFDLAREKLEAARGERRHFFGQLVGRDLDEAIGNADDDGFLGADDFAGDPAEGRFGFRDSKHVHTSSQSGDLKQVKLRRGGRRRIIPPLQNAGA